MSGSYTALLPQRLADALRDAAVALAVDQHRVYRPAAIVDRRIADDLDHAGLRIDLDLADRAGIGEGRDAHDLIGNPDQRPAQLGGNGVARRRFGGLEQADGAVGPGHDETPPDEFDIGLGDFEHGGGDPPAFVDDLVGGLGRHPGAEPHRARRGRAAAGLHPIGVAGDKPDPLGIDAEPFADDLREARFVPLARRHRAQHELDGARRDRSSARPARAARRYSARSKPRCRCRDSGRAPSLRPGAPRTRPSRQARRRDAARPDSRRCRKRGRAGCGTASPRAAPGCAGAGRAGRSRGGGRRCRSAVRGRTRLPDARRCDRPKSASCWSRPRRRADTRPGCDRRWRRPRSPSPAARTRSRWRRDC